MCACLVIIEFEFLMLIDYHDFMFYMLCGNLVRLSATLYELELVVYPLCIGPNNYFRHIQLQTKSMFDAIYKYLSVRMLYALIDANTYNIDIHASLLDLIFLC